MTAQDHNKIIGTLFLIFGGVNILLLIPASFQILSAFTELQKINKTGGADVAAIDGYLNLLLIIIFVLCVFSVVSSIVQITAGYGMLKRKIWARSAGALAGIVALINLPIGTALGVYALWFFFGRHGKKFYSAPMFAPPQPPTKF